MLKVSKYMIIMAMCAVALVRCDTPTEAEDETASEPPKYVVTNEVVLDVEIRPTKNSEPIKSGRIVIGLFGDICPMTATNFLQLAKGFKRDNVIIFI